MMTGEKFEDLRARAAVSGNPLTQEQEREIRMRGGYALQSDNESLETKPGFENNRGVRRQLGDMECWLSAQAASPDAETIRLLGQGSHLGSDAVGQAVREGMYGSH